jgi:septum formation protein
MTPRLILASASPQRKTLLEGLGFPFEVIPSRVDEPAHPETDPAKRAHALACAKACDVATLHPDAWVIGSDTLVVAPDGTLLEKPADAEDARRMLRLQSGGTSAVHSGLCLIAPDGRVWSDVSSSDVRFAQLGETEVEWWIGTGHWQGRSGGFQIDGEGQLLIAEIRGDWTSIVGLPVFLLGQLMKKAGAPFLGE